MDAVPGGASNIQDIYPLAPLQEGIYFHYLMSGKNNGDVYVLPSLLAFSSLKKREQFIEEAQDIAKMILSRDVKVNSNEELYLSEEFLKEHS